MPRRRRRAAGAPSRPPDVEGVPPEADGDGGDPPETGGDGGDPPEAGGDDGGVTPEADGAAALEDGEDDAGDPDDDADAGPELTLRITRAPGRRRRRPHLDPAASDGPALVRGAVRGGLLVLPARAAAAAPKRRFETAAAQPPDRGGGAGDVEVLEELASAPLVGMGRVPYSSNAVFVVELDAPSRSGTGRLHAVYKPAAGERPLWDFPRGTLHLREVATYLVDAALGFGLVPPTVLRDGPHGPGSMQLVVETSGRRLGGRQRRALEPAILDMAALDVLVNNADRKSAHLLVDSGGRLWGIDHGLTFLPYPRQRTVLVQLGGAELPARAAAAVAALRDDADRRADLVDHLGMLLDADEVTAFAARLEELADDPVYPELDPWDGRPFEWW